MANIENIKVGNTTYPLRDKNTYRSLSDEQATTLLDTGTYEGELIPGGTIFSAEDGSFQELVDTQAQGSYESLEAPDWGGMYYFKGHPMYTNYRGYGTLKTASKSNDVWSWTTIVNAYQEYAFYKDDVFYFLTGYKTTDGVNFSQVSFTKPWTISNNYFFRVAKNRFILIDKDGNGDYRYMYSDDTGLVFTAASFPTTNRNSKPIVLGYSDALYNIDKTTGAKHISTNLGTWSNTGDTVDLSYFSDDKYQVVNDILYSTKNGTAYYSLDRGQTFTACNFGETVTNCSFSYCKDKNLFVCVGTVNSKSKVYTSQNGTTVWTNQPIPEEVLFGGFINGYDGSSVCCYLNSGSNGSFAMIGVGVTHTYSLTPLSYNKASVDTALSGKQDTLTAGTGIDITGNVISATGGGGSVTLSDIAIAGEGITFTTDTPVTGENFTKVGTPTITDKVVTRLDSSNYLAATGDGASFNVGSNPWEIKAKVSFDSITDQAIFAAPSDMNNLVIGINGNKNFYLLATSNGTTWINWTTHTGSYTVQANTIYWIKAGYDGSNYYLKYSLDGETYIDDAFYTAGDKMRTAPLYIHAGWSQTFSGHLYLEEVSASIDGVVVWTPYVTSGTGKEIVAADADTISGYSFPATNHYTTETVTASGTTFTAPANGYYVARGTATSGGQYLELVGVLDSLVQSFTNLDLAVTLPVLKGQTVTLYYNTNTPSLKFVYAEGAS